LHVEVGEDETEELGGEAMEGGGERCWSTQESEVGGFGEERDGELLSGGVVGPFVGKVVVGRAAGEFGDES